MPIIQTLPSQISKNLSQTRQMPFSRVIKSVQFFRMPSVLPCIDGLFELAKI